MYIASPLLSIISNTFITTIFTSNSYGSLPKLSSPVTSLITRTPVSKFIPFTINCGSKYWLKFNCQDYAGWIKNISIIVGHIGKNYIPGQGSGLQIMDSNASPSQAAPPYSGGVATTRLLVLNPPPQVSVHSVKFPQGPHTQSSIKLWIKHLPIIIYNKLVTKQNIYV